MRVCLYRAAASSPGPYLNPLFIQTVASQLSLAGRESEIQILDGMAGDALDHVEGSFIDVLIVDAATPSELQSTIVQAIAHVSSNSLTVVCGELVMDLGPEAVSELLLRGDADTSVLIYGGLDPSELVGFLVRWLSRLEAFGMRGALQELPAGGILLGNPPTIRAAHALSFTSSIDAQIRERGLFLLVEGLSRGCEHGCTYCHLQNARHTRQSVVIVEHDGDDLVSVSRRHCEHSMLFFADENFFGGINRGDAVARMDAVCEMAGRLRTGGFKGSIGVDTHVATVPGEHLDPILKSICEPAWDSLQEAGLSYAYLGVESFSETQLARYGKRDEMAYVEPAIAELQRRRLDYTVGLILFDPLVTAAEVFRSLETIDRLDLYANIASPIKPIRVQRSSAYNRLLKSRGLGEASTSADVVSSCRDPEVRRAWCRALPAHTLLTSSGYRHSDMVAYCSMLDGLNRSESGAHLSIPRLVGTYETRVLARAFAGASDGSYARGLDELTRELATSALAWVSGARHEGLSTRAHKVLTYTDQVFGNVLANIDQLRQQVESMEQGERHE